MKIFIYAIAYYGHGTKSLAHALAAVSSLEGGHEVIGGRTDGSVCDTQNTLDALIRSSYKTTGVSQRGDGLFAQMFRDYLRAMVCYEGSSVNDEGRLFLLKNALERFVGDTPFFDMNGALGFLWQYVELLPYDVRGIYLVRDPRTYIPAMVSGDIGGGINYGLPGQTFNVPGVVYSDGGASKDREKMIERHALWWDFLHSFHLKHAMKPAFHVEHFNRPETAAAILETVYPEHSSEELEAFTVKLCTRKDHDGPVVYQADGYPIKGGDWEKGIAAKPFYQWKKTEQDMVYRICGETMEKLGYRLDEPYFQA